jgi:glycopeptide antibiotics resistance protein
VDNLLLNTLGSTVGYFIYTWFLRFLPKRERVDRKSAEHSGKIGYLRRVSALWVDD